MTCSEAREWIGAYADNELDLGQSAELRAHLATCDECSAELEAIRSLSVSVKKVVPFEAPERLARRIEAALPKPERRPKPFGGFALAFAAGLVVAVGAVSLIRLSGDPKQELVAEIVQSHTRSLMPGHLIDVVSSDRHTVKPWFTGKTPISPTPWNLAKSGFPLLGGRLDLIDGRPIPVLVYGLRKHFVNLFVFSKTDGDWSADRDGYHLLAWNDAGLEYVAVSDADAPDLGAFERLYRAAR
jgi:anti-sigma factor RsiW